MNIIPESKTYLNFGNNFNDTVNPENKSAFSNEELVQTQAAEKLVHALATETGIIPNNSAYNGRPGIKQTNKSRSFTTLFTTPITKGTVLKALSYTALAVAGLGLGYLATSRLNASFNVDNQNTTNTSNQTSLNTSAGTQSISSLTLEQKQLLKTYQELFKTVPREKICLETKKFNQNSTVYVKDPKNINLTDDKTPLKTHNSPTTQNTSAGNESTPSLTHEQKQLFKTYQEIFKTVPRKKICLETKNFHENFDPTVYDKGPENINPTDDKTPFKTHNSTICPLVQYYKPPQLNQHNLFETGDADVQNKSPTTQAEDDKHALKSHISTISELIQKDQLPLYKQSFSDYIKENMPTFEWLKRTFEENIKSKEVAQEPLKRLEQILERSQNQDNLVETNNFDEVADIKNQSFLTPTATGHLFNTLGINGSFGILNTFKKSVVQFFNGTEIK